MLLKNHFKYHHGGVTNNILINILQDISFLHSFQDKFLNTQFFLLEDWPEHIWLSWSSWHFGLQIHQGGSFSFYEGKAPLGSSPCPSPGVFFSLSIKAWFQFLCIQGGPHQLFPAWSLNSPKWGILHLPLRGRISRMGSWRWQPHAFSFFLGLCGNRPVGMSLWSVELPLTLGLRLTMFSVDNWWQMPQSNPVKPTFSTRK